MESRQAEFSCVFSWQWEKHWKSVAPMNLEGRPDLAALIPQIHKIVVVDLGFLGDTVHLVPALWQIHCQFPAASLQVVTTPVGGAVLSMLSCVEKVWTLNLERERRSTSEQWKLVRALRHERFDLALNFSGSDRTVILTWLTGARRRISRKPTRWHFWNPWIIHHWVPYTTDHTTPVYLQRTSLLTACGLSPEPPCFGIDIPADARRWSESVVPRDSIHLSLNASTHLKEWPLSHWIALSRLLLASIPSVHLVATAGGDPREHARLESWRNGVGSSRAHGFANPALPQFAALLTRCRLHIGSDSGALHLAMALGLRTLSMFREFLGMEGWMPQGPNHRHLSVPCPFIGQSPAVCQTKPDSACLAGLTPDRVFTELHDMGFLNTRR